MTHPIIMVIVVKLEKKTYVFKVVQNCKIKADVYRVPDNLIHPLILWIHGGALIGGDRGGIRADQLEGYVKAGYAVVSIDYRLAPESKLKAIVEDVQDAYKWAREEGLKLFNTDPDRIVVVGHSAGGYLTLMTGFCVNPRPKGLVSYYGYCDIAGDWYSRPDPFYCRQPKVSREEAYASIGTKIISELPLQNVQDRGRFYLYCRQQGLWPKEVTGYDPHTESSAYDSLCPIRNVHKKYPPTMLLHGTNDTDVPYRQSEIMATELERVGVEYEFITIPQGGHGFDGAGLKDVSFAPVFQKVLAFLDKHVMNIA